MTPGDGGTGGRVPLNRDVGDALYIIPPENVGINIIKKLCFLLTFFFVPR